MAATNDDPLGQWLRAAGSLPPPIMPPDFPQRVHRLAGRRRKQRATAIAAATVASVLVATWCLHPLRGLKESAQPRVAVAPPRPAPVGTDAAAFNAAIARLDAEAEAQTRIAARLIQITDQYRRLDALATEIQQPDAVELAQREVDQTSRLLVIHADRLEREHSLEAAAQTYRRVVELFAETAWAQVARQKLEKMNERKGAI